MTATATREGFAAARRAPRLALTLWLVNLSLALAAGVPGFLAVWSAIGLLPGADALGEGFSLGVRSDLGEMRPGLLGGLALSAIGVAFLGLLVGAVATGGALEVLMSRDDRRFAHRFGRGAGRFFGRFLRAGLLAGLVGALALGLYIAFGNAVPESTGPLVLLMVVAQQAFVLVRSGLRVALLGSEIALVERLRPLPAAPATAAPEPPQPVVEPEPPLPA